LPCFNGQFNEQTDGVAMGSSLSPVIATYFMEYFEEMALESATYKAPLLVSLRG
jgi:hypothetical protein